MSVKILKPTHFDEGLDFASGGELLLTHTAGHFSWVALDTGDNGVGVFPLLGSLIHLLDDDDLFASVTALEDDCDLNILTKSQILTQSPQTRIPCRACIL